MTSRASSTRRQCVSIARVPRVVVPISLESEARAMPTIANATSASMSVNPAAPHSAGLDRDNLHAPCQPIDSNLVAEPGFAQRDHTAARKTRWEKLNR